MNTPHYDHKAIEEKWQERWQEQNLYAAAQDSAKKKFYCLIEFPYPSGEGLHVGHVRSYTALDIIARKRRAEGYNVLYPIGWDAFGLPAENYAIKTNIHPAITTKQNTDNYRRQLQALGFSFNWSREINTTDPKYYKWTQWIFLQLFKKGLAYKAKIAVNWCSSCKTVLANEEVINGACERCGTPTEKREKEQWMLAITKYADRLYDDLENLDFAEKIKVQQRNWIGKSNGVLIDFPLENSKEKITVFTTRADTLFGVTYLVLAPEHPFVSALHEKITNWNTVAAYCKQTSKQKETERVAEGKEKTGIQLVGLFARNPANNEKIPVWIADYVLLNYGTGAIMAVPAHDQRDFEFAKKFNLPCTIVVCPHYPEKTCPILDTAYTGDGHVVASGQFNGQPNINAAKNISAFVHARKHTTYKLRDWVFSRQRYWGEPIPIIICVACGFVPVPLKDLPVILPMIENFKPTEDGESPLAAATDWVHTICPACGKPAMRETDTMPNWAGSSWYYLRYIDPQNDTEFANKEVLAYWTPVDWYNGGMEHTTLHLLYSRFWHKFLFDEGHVPSPEPYKKRTSHGLVLAEGGEKMSKSKGNVINPDDMVLRFGADTVRIYEMFMGPFEQATVWSIDNMIGSRRFLERVFRMHKHVSKENKEETDQILTNTIKKVGEDIERMYFNTAISSLMILANYLEKKTTISRNFFETFLLLLAPFAPHITEELWSMLGHTSSIHREPWPTFDPSVAVPKVVTIIVQINGKARGTLSMPAETDEAHVREAAEKIPLVARHLLKQTIQKVIFVKNRVINLVIS
ncbi:MAG: leucyl-tRNA synthetase [Parcubacteria group bacterium Gr01-1014_48]|nr:MAG: leucyl-tRNA synthetase [Parcubacteria group bacterium Greene0416_14]TSC74423.1 MAG: leucyl-tRNA synthetase [Parcubacteria group bacterium Gr01-1014_48]TSD01276.1 MAG: leucyl-tRNA synthetase [Parcubacteria group bacterium Greene1014_15]TSD08403.1 MAG: leucyl-tRNA synthetase [Parcubacteria group bacterium Greene0714_4]